ncbi:hypothetical protein [Streptomyces roseoverticillatus]|uniref:hypothetical protein n=1 Tax=Streptomyces roseoverticillatus TaxID=66429 RepID=UPI000694506B|nr:hypothetical protein [Streptomyces roseoverticillatus]
MSSRAAYAAAADELASRVLRALRGTEDAGDTALVAPHLDSAPGASGAPDFPDSLDSPGSLAALAAVRVIGADTFTPHVLTGAPFHASDAAAVARAFEAFPVPGHSPSAPPDERTAAWRDWATAQLLARTRGYAGNPVPATLPETRDDLTDTTDWQRWSVRMAQLAPLATPVLEGPVRDAARDAALPLSRGLTRSVLRRDFPTAVRLLRWLALLRHDGVALPLEPEPVLDHIRLLGGAGPRTALDLAVAAHLLTGRTEDARTQPTEAPA